jgi:hypothetical protein
MSTSIHVSWDCECEPSTTTGWICSNNDVVYCNSCEGVIQNTDKLTIKDLQAYTERYRQEMGLI